MAIISKERLEQHRQMAEKAFEEIRRLTPLITAELASLNNFEFIHKVCEGNAGIAGAVNGEFLFQCATQHNKLYFDRLNRNKKTSLIEENTQPDIEVNVVGIIRFAMTCPRAGSSICKLRDFTFETNDYKQKVKEF
ncbi:MAG: hypothetical protein ACP5QX_07495 [Caldisericaceae bacterium]